MLFLPGQQERACPFIRSSWTQVKLQAQRDVCYALLHPSVSSILHGWSVSRSKKHAYRSFPAVRQFHGAHSTVEYVYKSAENQA